MYKKELEEIHNIMFPGFSPSTKTNSFDNKHNSFIEKHSYYAIFIDGASRRFECTCWADADKLAEQAAENESRVLVSLIRLPRSNTI